MATAPDDYVDFEDDFLAAEPASPRRAGIAGLAETKLHGLFEDGRGELVRSLDSLVHLVEELAGRTGTRDGNPIAGFAHQAVDAIADIRDTLRDRPIDALIDDGREVVRRQPEIAVGVAVATGFLVARLIKASR